MSKISLQITRLDPTLPLPKYAYEGDAGLDLISAVDVAVAPFERVAIPTGLALAIPSGYAGFVLPRSGLALKQGLSLANTPGLIDSNYRGEIKVAAVNIDSSNPIEIHRGDRIAQLVLLEVPIVNLVEVNELDETVRGSNGFGSSSVSSGVEFPAI